MAASDQNNRRAEKAEIARHITTEETVAFMTALVAFLKEAEGAGHHDRNGAQPLPSDVPPGPTHAIDPAPAEAAPDQRPVSGEQHADASAPPAGETATALHMDAASGVSHVDGKVDIAATT